MTRFRIGVLVGVAAVLVAACGSSGSSKPGGSGSTTRSTAPASGARADKAIAHAALLHPSDFPGFTSTPGKVTSSNQLIQTAKAFPVCDHFVATKQDGRAQAQSPRYARGDLKVDESVDVYATAADITAQLDLYRDPATVECLRMVFTKLVDDTVPTGTTVQQLSVSPIAVDDHGDGQFAFRLTVVVAAGGQTQTALSDIVGVQVGRGGCSLQIDATDTGTLAETESRLLPIATERLRRALG
ncbi:MAG: hypothetical protein ACXVJ7_07485 [Acidimicrobiia bacterium]